jgi:wobble nucleotide-excising tRNase
VQINRINKIKGHKIFRDFTWDTDLLPFARYNLIYGWNGSGKTILASLFRYLQNRSNITEGDVEFLIGNSNVSGRDFDTAHLPDIRVFDRDFVSSTILEPGEHIRPIYYFGEDSVEKQSEVERLKSERIRAETELENARVTKSHADKELDSFYVSKAKAIKDLLTSSSFPKYNYYDKGDFKRALEDFPSPPPPAFFLTEEKKEKARNQKNAQPKDLVLELIIEVPDFEGIKCRAGSLLNQSVVSEILDELAEDTEVSNWVQRGLSLHSGARATSTCRFCGGTITGSRLRKLEGHFNDAFKRFQSDVKLFADDINKHRQSLGKTKLPEPTLMYGHHINDLRVANSEVQRLLDEAVSFLASIYDALLEKHKSPFEQVTLDSILEGKPLPDPVDFEEAITAVNIIIEKHNEITDEFQNAVENAYKSLEQSYIAEAYDEYQQLKNATDNAAANLHNVEDKPTELNTQIDAIERDIVEHLGPARELNADLRSYLGRDELRFEVEDTGYVMKRGGQLAYGLSEGEKTAIAFLYFLKSLRDKSFDINEGIVVVDDPVSSLDANSLFSAFGYMKERTKEAGQLFILTHNFAFFRQVKNWFHYIKGQGKRDVSSRPARFYLLEACFQNGQRSAVLKPLDRLLVEYESEYHYLFKKVYEEVSKITADRGLEQYYGTPNIARRLLETFLAFRYPDLRGDFTKRLDHVDFEPEKKARILRLLHTYSHSNSIEEPEHDLTVLSETRVILRDLLDLIKRLDIDHYEAMVRSLST